jgi:hypothetical protein
MTPTKANTKYPEYTDYTDYTDIKDNRHSRETWGFTYFLSIEESKMKSKDFLNNFEIKMNTFFKNSKTNQSHVINYVFQLEKCPITSRLHVHCAFQTDKGTRPIPSLQETFKDAHILILKNYNSWCFYCCKSETRVENTKPVTFNMNDVIERIKKNDEKYVEPPVLTQEQKIDIITRQEEEKILREEIRLKLRLDMRERVLKERSEKKRNEQEEAKIYLESDEYKNSNIIKKTFKEESKKFLEEQKKYRKLIKNNIFHIKYPFANAPQIYTLSGLKDELLRIQHEIDNPVIIYKYVNNKIIRVYNAENEFDLEEINYDSDVDSKLEKLIYENIEDIDDEEKEFDEKYKKEKKKSIKTDEQIKQYKEEKRKARIEYEEKYINEKNEKSNEEKRLIKENERLIEEADKYAEEQNRLNDEKARLNPRYKEFKKRDDEMWLYLKQTMEKRRAKKEAEQKAKAEAKQKAEAEAEAEAKSKEDDEDDEEDEDEEDKEKEEIKTKKKKVKIIYSNDEESKKPKKIFEKNEKIPTTNDNIKVKK